MLRSALRFWLLLVGLLGAAVVGRAQQLVCERTQQWPLGELGSVATDLLQLEPDSLRLLGDYRFGPQASNGAYSTITSLRRLRLSTCDTLPVRGTRYQAQTQTYYNSSALVTRRGQMLVVNSPGTSNAAISLRLLDRNGQTRWARSLTIAPIQYVSGLLEAPDRGFFLTVLLTFTQQRLVRLDSMGTVLWQRPCSRGTIIQTMTSPAYTRAGTLLFHARYNDRSGLPTTGVIELNQNGDSLTTRSASPDPQQVCSFFSEYKGSLIPLRDGGFLVASQVDSAGKGYYRPFLTRLDQNLNVVWSTIYRQQATREYSFTHPYELADGTFVVTVTNNSSGYAGPYWLFRYSAAGVLLQRYAFTSPLLVSLHQTGQSSNVPLLYPPTGLQPLSDSTFMLAASPYRSTGTSFIPTIYLAHIKVPGLRRVIDSHYIPAANSPLATHAPAAIFPAPAYPNPATTSVTVPLPAAPALGQLWLLDGLGRLVRSWPVAAGATSATLAVGGLTPGLYLLRLERAGQAAATQRLSIGP